jgi:hypothetical protein
LKIVLALSKLEEDARKGTSCGLAEITVLLYLIFRHLRASKDSIVYEKVARYGS